MSDIDFNFEYKGTKEEAVCQLKNMEQKAREKYPQYDGCWEVTWKDNGGLVDARFMGMDIAGQFDIVERDSNGGVVKVSITLPVLMAMMKGPIESQIKSEIQKMLG